MLTDNYGKIGITGSVYMGENGMDMAVVRYADKCDICISTLTATPTTIITPVMLPISQSKFNRE